MKAKSKKEEVDSEGVIKHLLELREIKEKELTELNEEIDKLEEKVKHKNSILQRISDKKGDVS